MPADEDSRLINDTVAVIAAKPDVLLATTAYGMRGWFEAADAAGLGPALLDSLAGHPHPGARPEGARRAAGRGAVGLPG